MSRSAVRQVAEHPTLAAIRHADRLVVRQRRELWELAGVETANSYQLLDGTGALIGYAAEEKRGTWGFLLRQLLGHWRTFTIRVLDPDQSLLWSIHHPFRLILKRIEVITATGQRLGALQERFTLFSKRFQLEDAAGNRLFEVNSPIWRIRTFDFLRGEVPVARVTNQWDGILTEVFTDRDNFVVEYFDPGLPLVERVLILASAIFVDLLYFEDDA